MSTDREKTCATCGRSFAWRAKWAREWDAVRHCSERCRRSRPSEVDARIEALLLELVDARGAGKTICPSEVARALRPDEWREWMERVRQAARRLVTRGELAIYQGGHVVDPDHARGALRIGRPPHRPLVEHALTPKGRHASRSE
ncbi:MAG: DUF2256 and DUF3253 domain-containing protein [Myxococcota bacterium]|nr:DUF2256 and DUF3253 domain-containing protein [Myxococcota bacterium]